MSDGQSPEITQILHEWSDGDDAAREVLLREVYGTLKRQARFLMSRERSNHTLQPTALVHEAFLKLGNAGGIQWQDRGHFFGFTSRLMRQILVDHARLHAAGKRGNNPIHFSTDDVDIPVEDRADSILVVDQLLDRLAAIDERQAKVVEMRFFGGMTNGEIAEAIGTTERTVLREWQSARLWLYREISQGS
ncbi:MAG TPA: sigma-70 family RNA polymerase sigma factor [Pyrinomonadaceae bacterium]|nr:sigma-70 family RNA polymerase sigma factor [Chloracidobacterium sp.]MBP9935733.1 sigma-70 family RNA polymerase sigma factor [Pyrinomonadaceae bacterium]MBK7801806.1 sigma-70 family RNA polymerase sigma factor [Chloracidobacterium sp.]MBK9438046.1 sigma-70 family RNA polymerase sigma factor [Chloracidobacterium sp.]MBL0242115.1 sigma-70 family RNA polymerase sigma factor [Chloracidobacterium sp.]